MVTLSGSPPNASICLRIQRSPSRSIKGRKPLAQVYRQANDEWLTIMQSEVANSRLLHFVPTEESEH